MTPLDYHMSGTDCLTLVAHNYFIQSEKCVNRLMT